MNKKIKKIIAKKNKSKILSLTAYSKNIAQIIDKYVDMILVGDSMASVLYNYNTTRKITLDTMIEHAKSVRMGINNSLMCLKDRKLNRSEVEEIRDLKTLIKDKNYRILLSEDRIHLFNKDILKTGTDPYDFFDSLDLSNDISHAFYLGVELSRAQIALQLGKNYSQDNELSWGIIKTDEKIDYKVRPKIKSTQKK